MEIEQLRIKVLATTRRFGNSHLAGRIPNWDVEILNLFVT